ncbi:NAD(P)-dependent oxidoreductase [Actinocrispum wychmicini]|uniref:Putative NADH-flavin reductase n=1 Tax=Actinocrispum wychmicini TaxID=1213861 RepID=A0A4R2J0J8_9PSEU|nr:SDR family oxidoreductase [Actinocrispum wychmicini]TCO50902.1 putative NADH-flavin reductase [Actinocrispum wychmicini]
MKITIFAATGGVGHQVLEQAVAAGHDVTAVVRTPSKVTAPVNVVAVDLSAPDPAALESAISGADAVLSGLGARTKADAGIATRGTQAMIDAMKATDVRRLVVISAAPVGTMPAPGVPHPPKYDPGEGFFMRHVLTPTIKRILRGPYTDLATMEQALRDSDLDWTIIRPPQLTDQPLSGEYRTAYGQNLRRGMKISRADVAHLMLHVLQEPRSVRAVMGLAY